MGKVFYTAQPIDGIVEHRHPPVATRVAREKLKAIIEDDLMKFGLVEAYTIIDDSHFPFPFKMPDILAVNGFFGESPDLNAIKCEMDELFSQPQRELKEDQEKVQMALTEATDEQLLEMMETYHYTGKGTRQKFEESLTKVRELWKPYGQISSIIEKAGFSGKRGDLVKALSFLDNCHNYGLMEDLNRIRASLQQDKRSEAVERIELSYHDWTRKNLARLYNVCGDAKFYGAGFWIARIIPSVTQKNKPDSSEAKATLESRLAAWKMSYQIVEL